MAGSAANESLATAVFATFFVILAGCVLKCERACVCFPEPTTHQNRGVFSPILIPGAGRVRGLFLGALTARPYPVSFPPVFLRRYLGFSPAYSQPPFPVPVSPSYRKWHYPACLREHTRLFDVHEQPTSRAGCALQKRRHVEVTGRSRRWVCRVS